MSLQLFADVYWLQLSFLAFWSLTFSFDSNPQDLKAFVASVRPSNTGQALQHEQGFVILARCSTTVVLYAGQQRLSNRCRCMDRQ